MESVSPAEAQWVIHRLAEMIGWPMPAEPAGAEPGWKGTRVWVEPASNSDGQWDPYTEPSQLTGADGQFSFDNLWSITDDNPTGVYYVFEEIPADALWTQTYATDILQAADSNNAWEGRVFQLVDANVAHATNARHQRPTRKIPRAWSAEELATFLPAARPQRLYPALHLTAYTGMRRGEVAGIKWSDLDRANQRLSISRTIQSIAGQPVEFPVKTRTSRRCIDLDDATMDVLARWRRHLRREGLAHGADDWMFLNTAGRFINPESLSQLFDRLQRTMPDLTRIRFHDLRHTHASLLIMDGVPVKVVSERLGHANVAFTIHTYQHLLPGMSAAAAQQFAALLAAHAR